MRGRRNGGGSAYERVFLGMAVVVTVVWAIATLVQVAIPGHPVPEYANLAMMGVVGSFFSAAAVAGYRNGKNGDDH